MSHASVFVLDCNSNKFLLLRADSTLVSSGRPRCFLSGSEWRRWGCGVRGDLGWRRCSDVLKDPRRETGAVPSVATQQENCSSNASPPNEESAYLMRELINTYGCYSLISLRIRVCMCAGENSQLCEISPETKMVLLLVEAEVRLRFNCLMPHHEEDEEEEEGEGEEKEAAAQEEFPVNVFKESPKAKKAKSTLNSFKVDFCSLPLEGAAEYSISKVG